MKKITQEEMDGGIMRVPHFSNARQYEQSIAMYQEKLGKAQDALKEFGDHKSSCATNAPQDDFGHLLCTCGLAKAIKEIQ